MAAGVGDGGCSEGSGGRGGGDAVDTCDAADGTGEGDAEGRVEGEEEGAPPMIAAAVTPPAQTSAATASRTCRTGMATSLRNRDRVCGQTYGALNPELIIADEPVSALDVSIQAQVVNLLEELQERLGLTYLVIAHDLAVVRHISDDIAVMYLGSVVEVAASDELYARPLHPYTIALLSAIPIPDPEVEDRRERVLLTGELPSAADPPPGCRFHTRCPFRQPARCSDEVPALRVLEAFPGSQVACHFAEQIAAGELTPASPP